MTRCASACDPAEAVQASVTADWADDLWLCLCRKSEKTEKTAAPGT